jgi:hypothetical protein
MLIAFISLGLLGCEEITVTDVMTFGPMLVLVTVTGMFAIGAKGMAESRWVPRWLLSGGFVRVLRVTGVLFFLLAAYALADGLPKLFHTIRTPFFYGASGFTEGGFSYPLWESLFTLFMVFAVWGPIGGFFIASARRLRARQRLAEQADDRRAPVVYLRSFASDEPLSNRPRLLTQLFSIDTEEEQLAEVLTQIGPVVAIGKPGERLPRLGANRIYLDDSQWQEQVSMWFDRAVLVVINVSPNPTEGLAWEVDHALTAVPRDRLVFLVSREIRTRYWLNERLTERGCRPLDLQRLPRGPYRTTVSGVVYFEDNQPRFSGLKKAPLLRRPFGSVLVAVYQIALKPVIQRATGAWKPLPFTLGGVSVLLVAAIFVAAAVGYGAYLRHNDPFNREGFLTISRISSDPSLPPEVRDVLTNPSKVEQAGKWMRTQLTEALRYVGDDDIIAQAERLKRLLSIAPATECDALVAGTIGHRELAELVNRLAREDPMIVQAWWAFFENVLRMSVASEHGEEFSVRRAEFEAAMSALKAEMPPDLLTQFVAIAQDYTKAGAEERCWWMLTLLGSSERLADPYRAKLARGVLGQPLE